MGKFLTRLIVGVAALVVCAAYAPVDVPPVGAKEIAAFLNGDAKRYADDKTDFHKRLIAELSTKPDIAAASRTLAPEFALDAAKTRRLIELWIVAVLFHENFYFSYDPKVSGDENHRREAIFKPKLRDAFVAFMRVTKYARVAVIATAKALSSYRYDCSGETFSLIAEGAGVDVAWLVAQEANCGGFWRAANAFQPMNAAILLRIAEYGLLSDAQRIAVLEHTRKVVMTARPSAGYKELDGYIARNLIYAYWDGGFVDSGIQLYESLTPVEQQFVAEDEQPQTEVALDGHALKIPKTAAEFPSGGAHELHEQLAAVRLLQGKVDEARSVLGASGKFGEDVRANYACRIAGKRTCDGLGGSILRWAYLDLLLNQPEADPYDLFEISTFSAGGTWGESALWFEILLHTTRDAGYRSLVEDQAKHWNRSGFVPSSELTEREEFEATLTPELRARIAELEARFKKRVRAFGGAYAEGEREPIPAPKSAHFAELKMPPCATPRRPAVLKRYLKTLPPDYEPVRAERSGDVVAVISQSQNYNPGHGGFWVHLSNDRGKTWEAPRYTGLAAFFPYDVRAESCLALIAGDRLHVEVEIGEVDTSRMQPYVGVVPRRAQSGLYLDMLLSELRKDQDGDGLTDIAEESLLLDPGKADSDGDGVSDGKDPFPNVAYSDKRGANDEAMIAVLGELSKQGFFEPIEPIDFKPGDPPGGWSVPALAHDRPLFLGGNKADFGRFTAKRMTLVYSDEEIERIRRMKAAFIALRFSSLRLNRAGTRGFISWSAGVVGGMLRVVKDAKGWRAEVVTSWIR